IGSSPDRNVGTARPELVGETQLVVVVELSEVDMHFEEQKVEYG
ncbi:hypothetical protein Tco_0950163, partial [Tanacetum coccineum]